MEHLVKIKVSSLIQLGIVYWRWACQRKVKVVSLENFVANSLKHSRSTFFERNKMEVIIFWLVSNFPESTSFHKFIYEEREKEVETTQSDHKSTKHLVPAWGKNSTTVYHSTCNRTGTGENSITFALHLGSRLGLGCTKANDEAVLWLFPLFVYRWWLTGNKQKGGWGGMPWKRNHLQKGCIANRKLCSHSLLEMGAAGGKGVLLFTYKSFIHSDNQRFKPCRWRRFYIQG